MNCGTPGRTPPRRSAFAVRLILLVLPLLVACTVLAAPASAYRCEAAVPTLAGNAAKAGKSECAASEPSQKRGNADPISFLFFMGIIAAVLVVPVTTWRREGLSPE